MKVHTPQVLDDIDGTVLKPGDGETIPFTVRGVSYVIDVSDDNAALFDEALAPFIQAATRIKGRRQQRVATVPNRRNHLRAVREWAEKNGYELGERGRVPAYIENAYLESVAS